MNRILTGLFAFILTTSVISPGCEKKNAKIETANQQTDTNPQAVQLTAQGQSGIKFGPFDMGQKRITVTYDYGDKIAGDLLEIKDESGTSYLKETFHNDEESSLAVKDVFKLEGKSGEGIIITYELTPNAPPCGPEFGIYSMINGSLRALSPRIIVCGRIENPPAGSRNGTLKLLDGDLINVEVWTDFFAVKIPFKIDFQKMTIVPSTRTVYDIKIPYSINAIDTSEGNEITFYNDLHDISKADSIVASEIKKVEFLGANAEINLNKVSESQLDIKITNVCLKVRINDLEGWVIGANDFHILGLSL